MQDGALTTGLETLGLNGGWIFFESSLRKGSIVSMRGARPIIYVPVPVDVLGEERVPLDLVRASSTESARRVALEQLCHDALCVMRHVCRE